MSENTVALESMIAELMETNRKNSIICGEKIAQLTKERDQLAAKLEKSVDAADDEWLNAIGDAHVRMFGKPWETRDGETREEGLSSNITALFQLIEDARREKDQLAAKCAALESTCGAVLHSLRSDGMISDHSDESQLLLNAVGERRTERDAQLMLAGKLQLLNRAEAAEAKCAEMREAIELARHYFIRSHAKNLKQLESMPTPFDHALLNRCGAGWLSPEKKKVLVEALKGLLPFAQSYSTHQKRNPNDLLDIQLDAAKQALEACK